MGVLEISILVAIAVVVFIVIRRLPDTRPGVSSAAGGGARSIGVKGSGVINRARNVFFGIIKAIGNLFGRKSVKGVMDGKSLETENFERQLKKPEDRDFWIDRENKSTLGNHAMISKTYFDEAEVAFKARDYRKAEALFIEAARENPKNAKIFNRLGVIYLEQKNYEDAIESFSTAIKYDNMVSSRYYNLALAYVGQGNYKEAVNNLKSAIELSPDNEKYKQVLEQMKKKC